MKKEIERLKQEREMLQFNKRIKEETNRKTYLDANKNGKEHNIPKNILTNNETS